MLKGKGYLLKQLTRQARMKSVDVGRELDGSTPPSVFIGSWNYPKVYAGPLMAAEHGDTYYMDAPEEWVGSRTQDDIIDFRLNLVRGKHEVKVTDLDDKMVERLQEISLSKTSVDGEAVFKSEPRGRSFNERSSPHGPSAVVDHLMLGYCRWDRSLEKTYYDTDLKAADAVTELHRKGVPFTRIQKAFSTGTMGCKRRRRMVPTRWSITACDSTIGDRLLDDVRHNEILDCFQVREYVSLNNYYAVLLLPTAWQYEWTEAFLHGRRPHVFSDHETNAGKRGYSRVGGCYYSCKLGVLEALEREKTQAGAIILREAYPGYVPLGVFNVRENVRSAMNQQPSEYNTLDEALDHVSQRLKLPLNSFEREGELLRDVIRGRQTTLNQYAC